jgi:hypothetical protein
MTTIYELNAETAMTADMQFAFQKTSAATRPKSATFALMGGLEVTSGSDAATAMAVGNLYVVDMSGWATADRIYSLPTTAQVGERIGVFVSSGNASYELQLRTTAASNDTINGVDHDSTDWSKLFITGECVIFRCVTANTAWIVEYDGRIPCIGSMYATATQTGGAVSATWSVVAFDTAPAAQNLGALYDLTNERFNIRRDGIYHVTGQCTVDDVQNGTPPKLVSTRLYLNDTTELRRGSQEISDDTQSIDLCSTLAQTADFDDGDYIELEVFQSSTSDKDIVSPSSANYSLFYVQEQF